MRLTVLVNNILYIILLMHICWQSSTLAILPFFCIQIIVCVTGTNDPCYWPCYVSFTHACFPFPKLSCLLLLSQLLSALDIRSTHCHLLSYQRYFEWMFISTFWLKLCSFCNRKNCWTRNMLHIAYLHFVLQWCVKTRLRNVLLCVKWDIKLLILSPKARPPGIPGSMSLEKFPREFLGILLPSAFNFLYSIISSFDIISVHTVQDIMLRFIRVLLIKVSLATSVPIKSDLIGLPTYFLPPILFRRRTDWWFCTDLNRVVHIFHLFFTMFPLFNIRMTDWHRCPVWQAY